MKTIINQKELEFELAPNAAAVDIIRDEAGLTGTKFVWLRRLWAYHFG